ncbi:hypothetical protein [Methanoplanus limicola]|nr:hypothetical protein [Methanoplanus limicola]
MSEPTVLISGAPLQNLMQVAVMRTTSQVTEFALHSFSTDRVMGIYD